MELLNPVDVRARIHQRLHHREISVLDREHQSALIVRVRGIHLRVGAEQHLHQHVVIQPGGFGQRHRAEFIDCIRIRFFRQERLSDVIILPIHSP